MVAIQVYAAWLYMFAQTHWHPVGSDEPVLLIDRIVAILAEGVPYPFLAYNIRLYRQDEM